MESEKPSSEKQQSVIRSLLADTGRSKPSEMRKYVCSALKRPVVTASDLTADEAAVLVKALERESDAQAEEGKLAYKEMGM